MYYKTYAKGEVVEMNQKNKLKMTFSYILILLLAIALIGCGASSKDKKQEKNESSGVAVKGLEEPIAEKPVVLTSIGQSADVQMVKALMDKAGLPYELNTVIKADELKDTTKTLILAVGGSSKGLGAAGIKAEDELERAKSLIKRAKEMNCTILAVHVGGETRRGELSDKFINASVPDSNYIIIVEDGNKDGLFTNLASQNNIPMDVVKSIAEVVEPLKKAFK